MIRSMESGSVRELRPGHCVAECRQHVSGVGARRQFPARHRQGQGRGGAVDIYRIDAQSGAASPLVVRRSGNATCCSAARPVAGRSNDFPAPKRIGSEVRRSRLSSRVTWRPATNERSLAEKAGLWGRGADVSPDGRTIAVPARDADRIDHAVARPGRWRRASPAAARVSAGNDHGHAGEMVEGRQVRPDRQREG